MADPAIPEPVPQPVSSRHSQYVMGALVVLVVALLGLRWWKDYANPRPAERTADSLAHHQIELNKADRTELMQLPGVGPARADKILAYRAAIGGFQRVEELRSVDGIGDITLDRLKPYVKVETPFDSDEPVRLIRKQPEPAKPTSSTKKPALEGTLDLNRASVADLEKLPGIGPTLAQRIADERDRKPFEKVDDLRRVSGIGVKRLDAIRPFVMIQN